jgi:hypothetical protein
MRDFIILKLREAGHVFRCEGSPSYSLSPRERVRVRVFLNPRQAPSPPAFLPEGEGWKNPILKFRCDKTLARSVSEGAAT